MLILLALDTAKVDSLWETAKLWRAGTNVPKVDSARNAIIGMGAEAVQYVVRRYLPLDDRLQTRALRDICLKVPKECSPAVDYVLNLKDTIAQKNALYVASEVSMPTLEPTLLRMLKREKSGPWIARILRALYRSGSDRVCKVVPKYSKHGYEYVRMRALILVSKYNCSKMKAQLWKGLNDSYFMVRDAARDGLLNLGFTADEVLRYSKSVERIELFKLLSYRCPSKELLLKLRPRNVFEKYWFDKIKCE